MAFDNIVYVYDGTFDGLCCCVWTAFARKENPADIWCFDEEQPTLYTLRQINTVPSLAARVQTGIRSKLGALAYQWVWDAYYSDLPHREHAALEFLKLGFARGPCVTHMLGHPQVAPIFAASRALHNEAHLYTGFVRFAVYGDALTATIKPKNFVLPLLEKHFSARFPNEMYMIYDQTHCYALAAYKGKSRMMQVENMELPDADPDEKLYQLMWARFYNAIAIQARHNPKCRMTHVPKRYWDCMEELQNEKNDLPLSVRQAIEAGELVMPMQASQGSVLSIVSPAQKRQTRV